MISYKLFIMNFGYCCKIFVLGLYLKRRGFIALNLIIRRLRFLQTVGWF